MVVPRGGKKRVTLHMPSIDLDKKGNDVLTVITRIRIRSAGFRTMMMNAWPHLSRVSSLFGNSTWLSTRGLYL